MLEQVPVSDYPLVRAVPVDYEALLGSAHLHFAVLRDEGEVPCVSVLAGVLVEALEEGHIEVVSGCLRKLLVHLPCLAFLLADLVSQVIQGLVSE